MTIIPISTILLAKSFLNFSCKEVKVKGLNNLLNNLNGESGILTSLVFFFVFYYF